MSTLKRGYKAMLAEASAAIETLSVSDLHHVMDDPNLVLVDVRDAAERARDGEIPGSVHAPRGMLEFHADPESPMHNPALRPDAKIVVYCASGARSTLAAKTLHHMGFADTASLAGGYGAWKKAQAGEG